MTTPPAGAPILDEALLRTLEERASAMAGAVGGMLLERFGTLLEVEFKGKDERSPVTEADRDAEAMLRSAIAQDFPDHSILGEEGEDLVQHESPFTWVLDPLDGTTNFINRLPLWAVSVGVLHEGVPVAAAIFTATSHRGGPGVYSARRGGGARLAGEPLTLPLQEKPRTSRLSGQPGHFARFARGLGEPFRRNQGEPRVLGSIAVELAFAAAGTLQYAIFGPPRIWDVAAGVLLVEEAGGLVMVGVPDRWSWMPLHRFIAPPPRRPDDAMVGVAGLRRWSSGLVAGSPQVVGFVTANMPNRRVSFWLRLARRLLRLLRRPRPAPGTTPRA